MLSAAVAHKLGTAAPVIDERLTALRADIEDVYQTVIALRERVLAFTADIDMIVEVAGQPPAPPAAEPAHDFVLVGAESVRAMDVTRLQAYCAHSVDIETESARNYVEDNSRFRDAFAVDRSTWTRERYHVNPLLWRWLANRPQGQPGDWPTHYALVRSLSKSDAVQYLRDAQLD